MLSSRAAFVRREPLGLICSWAGAGSTGLAAVR